MSKTILTTVLLAAVAAADAQTKPAAKPVQAEHKLEVKIPTVDRETGRKATRTAQVAYLLYLPKGYAKPKGERTKRWPLMLFLHGAGERGTNLARVKRHGPPKLVEAGKDFPFIVLSPQCPRGRWWDSAVLTALLDKIVATHAVDTGRIYVTGLSMGGFGTWRLGATTPQRFAALVPICGGGDPKTAAKLKDVPIWAFHGGRDRLVPPAKSREMIEAIKAAGGKKARLTVDPDAGHNSWTKAYADPELYKWLLKQKRRPKTKLPRQPKLLKTRT